MSMPAIEVESLSKRFGEHRALRDVSLRIAPGEMVALLGASGSGKSTLLRHLNGLHRADAGTLSHVRLFGSTLQKGGVLARDVRAMRAEVAAIFQQFNLVDRLPVMMNVMAGALHRQPLWRALARRLPAAEHARAWEALNRVGIERCAWQRASTLSGGQQQRAAIARALVQGARLILADEPVASLLAELNREVGVTIVVSLHQVEHAFEFCPRTVALRAGEVVFDGPTRTLDVQRLRALYGAQTDELFSRPFGDGETAGRPFVDLDTAAEAA